MSRGKMGLLAISLLSITGRAKCISNNCTLNGPLNHDMQHTALLAPETLPACECSRAAVHSPQAGLAAAYCMAPRGCGNADSLAI